MNRFLELGPVRLDLDQLRVSGPRGDHALTPLEGAFVRYLAAHRGSTVPRERLLTEVWGYSARAVTRAVDHTVSRLRKKIEVDPVAPQWLVSTRGGGYRLERDPPARRLPCAPDELIGRADALTELERLFSEGARLITILGPPGIGKTRVAGRYASSIAPNDPGGVLFVDVRDAADAEAVVRQVARGLGLPLGAHPHPATEAALGERARLLVLDHFDQVAAHADAIIGRWLRAATPLRVVVTSRVRLWIPGEFLLHLPPFSSTAGVDPVPATFEWSWRQLSLEERAALARLADFEAEFTLIDAEGALTGGETWGLDLIQALVDRSLVVRVGEDRLQVPEAARDYARAQRA